LLIDIEETRLEFSLFSIFTSIILLELKLNTGAKMSEKKWKHEKIIKLSDLKNLMLNFQLATNISVALRDESFGIIFAKQPPKKICSLFLEHSSVAEGCCDTVGDSIFSFGVEGFSVIKCGRGLSFFVVPIKIEKSTIIGYITGEAVFLTREDKQAFLDKLQRNAELRLNFDEIRDYLRDIELISLPNYKAKANFLMTSVDMLIQNSTQKYEIEEASSLLADNYKLRSKAEERVKRLTALNKVSGIINSTLELQTLLKTTIVLISEVMGVEICSLMLLGGDPQTLKIVVAHGLDETIIKSAKTKTGEGIAGYVAKTGKPLLITDISKDPNFSRYSKTGADYKTKSVLSVPLIIKDKVIGVINVNNKKTSDVFNDADLQLLETLATQIATAIENARLYSQKEQRLVEITMLHNLGLALNSSLDLKNIIARIIESMKGIFDADMASIMLWDERRERLRIISHIGLPEQYVNELTFAPGEGVAGTVAKKGKPRLIANTFLEPSYKKHNILHDELPKSLICSPILVKNRVEGVICCERLLEKNGPFNEDNLNLLTTISCHAAVAIENSNLYNDLLRVYLETVQSLAAALDAKDSYTHGHSRRVTGLALALAREIGMNENEINTLKHAALLHDIGKIGIAESILQKPSSLTNDEFNCIKNHPITGARILESVEFLKSVCLQIKHHHERFDGKGYPDNLKGDQIPLGSKIIALADTYDAMTSTRPYRKGLSHEVALEEIKRCAGSQFDPEIVGIFIKISDKCKKISEDIEIANDNIINISGIKSMVDGIIKPLSLF